MSAYNALKHFLRAEAELVVANYRDVDPVGLKVAGSLLSFTWEGTARVTISANIPQEGDIGTVMVYPAKIGPPDYEFVRRVRWPWEAKEVAATAVGQASLLMWRLVDTDRPF